MYNPDLEFAAPKIPPEIRQKARGNPGTQWTNPDNNRTYELGSNGRWRNVSKGQKPAAASKAKPKAKAKAKAEQKPTGGKAPAAAKASVDKEPKGKAREGKAQKSAKPGDSRGFVSDERVDKLPKRKVNDTWIGQGQKSPKPKPKPTRSPYGKGFKPSEPGSRPVKLEDLAQRLLSSKHGSYKDILEDLDKVVSPKKEERPAAPAAPTEPAPELAPDEPDEYDPPEAEPGPEPGAKPPANPPAKAPRARKAPKAPKASPAQQKFLDQVAKHDGPIQAENGRQRRSLEALVKKGMLTKSGDDYYRPDSPNIPKPADSEPQVPEAKPPEAYDKVLGSEESTPAETPEGWSAPNTEPESPGSLATATEPESSPIEKPASGGKSRWNKLIEDIDSYTAKDLELIDQSLALAAKIAPQYVKTLEDAGVSPRPQQPKPNEESKQIEESSSQPKPPRSRFNQLIDDLDELGDESTKALAKGLGVSADMAKTIKDLESRRGSTGTKQLTPQDRALAAAADAEADAAADAAADATSTEYDPNEAERDVEDGPDVPEGWSATKPKTASGQGGLSSLLSGEDVSHEDIDENEAREYLQMLREDRPKPGSKDYKDMVKIREILKKKKGG